MRMSEKGFAFLKELEALTSTPKDDNGHLMWGYGHDQLPGEKPPSVIDQISASALLRVDVMMTYEPAVNKLAPWANQNQFDALVCFAYNEGCKGLATMLSHGQDEVPVQMARWVWEHKPGAPAPTKSDGLATRRAKEIAYYNTPIAA